MKCKTCEINKGGDGYYKSNKSICKKCLNIKNMLYKKEHKETVAIIQKRYRDTHKKQESSYYKNWYETRGRELRHKRNPPAYLKNEIGLDKGRSIRL